MSGIEALVQLVQFMPLLCAAAAVYIMYSVMRHKVIVINADGTYNEYKTKSGQTKLDLGEKKGGVYLLRKGAAVKKMMLGILPINRTYFLEGCPEPISFHSGTPVYAVDDLKLPVYGELHCPKCKTTVMKITRMIGSAALRDIIFETRTRELGKPEAKKFSVKWLVYGAIIIGVLLIAYAAMQSGALGVKP